VCDSSGAIHVTGNLNDATGTSRSTILKSTDRGDTWVDENALSAGSAIVSLKAITTARVPVGENSFEEQLFAIATTNLYVTRPTDVGWVRGWGVVRSRDGGTTWQTICAPYDFGYWSQGSIDLAVDKDGRVYVVGSATERVQVQAKKTTTTDYYHWLVLRVAQTVPVATIGQRSPISAEVQPGPRLRTG
jgi:photosystem II stability/assembly factor-like uncharacterized protein